MPPRRATHLARRGHTPQRGRRGRQTTAPRSIKPSAIEAASRPERFDRASPTAPDLHVRATSEGGVRAPESTAESHSDQAEAEVVRTPRAKPRSPRNDQHRATPGALPPCSGRDRRIDPRASVPAPAAGHCGAGTPAAAEVPRPRPPPPRRATEAPGSAAKTSHTRQEQDPPVCAAAAAPQSELDTALRSGATESRGRSQRTRRVRAGEARRRRTATRTWPPGQPRRGTACR